MAEEVVKPQEEEEEEKKAEVSLTELIRELIQGKKEQKAKLIDVA
jgi:predicted CopG family antitoxin